MYKARMLHMVLVGDMQRPVVFYTRAMGMRVLRTFEQPEDRHSLTDLGYGGEAKTCVLELTCNHGVSGYDMGSAYGHIAIGVEDCSRACAEIEAKGGEVIVQPAPLKGADEVIAFVRDPDGYQSSWSSGRRPGLDPERFL